MTRQRYLAVAVGLLSWLPGCTMLSVNPLAVPEPADEKESAPASAAAGRRELNTTAPLSPTQAASTRVPDVQPPEDTIEVAGTSPYGTLPLPPAGAPRVERPRIVENKMPLPAAAPAQAVSPVSVAVAAPEPPEEMPPLAPAEPAKAPLAVQCTRDAPLVEALRSYLDERPADALASLTHYDKGNQEVLLNLLQVAARLTHKKAEADSAKETAHLLAQLERLEAPLRSKAELQIDKICFCSRIAGFGDYDPLPQDFAFRPGRLMLVYVELRNFTSTKQERHDETLFTTQVSGTAEIRDEQGQRVWRQEFRRDRPDQSKTVRHDYFDNYRFCLPELKPGLHTLWIRVTDAPTGRMAERSLDFHVKTAAVLSQ